MNGVHPYLFYPQDCMNSTLHLSAIEDCIYRRLIDAYYLLGGLLTGDIYKLARARSLVERKAVEDVLPEFFVKTENGWRHERIERDLERHRERVEQAAKHFRGKASA